uniref:Protein kinase domain-containing protein n=1 Tax=Panagrellus redivivus TaxID=6233 RepID=A0A7E4VDP2_PANRE
MSRVADIKALPISTGAIVCNQWQIVKKLGEGGFGAVYEVKNLRNPNQMGALKAEPFGAFKDDEVLKMEAHVLKAMSKSKHSTKLFATGKTPKYNFIVMTLLGKSLSDLRRDVPNMIFSRGTVVHIGLECLEAIEELHKVGFVHRDIKPSNFAIGRKKNQARNLFIYDFGLARQFLIVENGKERLRDPRKTVPFKGTVRYCSLNVHRFEEYGRHDDLWRSVSHPFLPQSTKCPYSMLYMLVEMYSGSLPWKGMDRRKAEVTKENCDEEFRKLMPREFLPIVKHLRKLNYLKTPDYLLIRDAISAAVTKNRLEFGAPLDWEEAVKHPKKGATKAAVKVSKAADERREAECNDQNTRCDVEDIDDNDYGYDDVASHVSGVSGADDTLQKLDEFKQT